MKPIPGVAKVTIRKSKNVRSLKIISLQSAVALSVSIVEAT